MCSNKDPTQPKINKWINKFILKKKPPCIPSSVVLYQPFSDFYILENYWEPQVALAQLTPSLCIFHIRNWNWGFLTISINSPKITIITLWQVNIFMGKKWFLKQTHEWVALTFIFAYLFHIWLERRQLASHICVGIQSVVICCFLPELGTYSDVLSWFLQTRQASLDNVLNSNNHWTVSTIAKSETQNSHGTFGHVK